MASNNASIMTSLNYLNDMYMDKNGTDIDIQIINYIAAKGIVLYMDIIANFARESQKKREIKEDNKIDDKINAENSGIVNEDTKETVKEESKESESKAADFKTSEENKKSKRTIQRRLAKMEEEGKIVEPTDEQLKRYGIKKKDGRVKYLTLAETIERDKDLDDIINRHIKKDNLDKKMVLREINRCKRYTLLPSQLDSLVSNLDIEDAELTGGFLNILHQYITKKEIKPKNKKELVEKLKKVLERYPEGHETHNEIRSHAIILLGHYEDKAVIEQLTKDSEAGRLSKFKEDYYGWTTAKAIKKARKKLFDLEYKLRRKGDTVNADALAKVRDKAEEVLETQKETDEHLKSEACEAGEKSNLERYSNYYRVLQN